MSLRIRAAALALAAVFGLAACSSSPSSPAAAGATASGPASSPASSAADMPSVPTTSTTMSMTPGAPVDTEPVAGNAVAIKGFAFSPAALTVKVGTKVTWTNDDADAHTVTSQNGGGPLQSAALATGQTYSYTFTQPGTYAYLCTIHPFMVATVTVTP